MNFINLARARAARLEEEFQKQRSARSSQSRSRTGTTKRRRSSSSSSSQARSGNSRTTTRRRSTPSSLSQSRAKRDLRTIEQQISQRASRSQSRAAATRSRGSGTSSESRSRSASQQVSSQSQNSTTSSQNQWRSVDGREDGALTFTFGDEVGKFLADTIKIGAGNGEIVSKTQMLLPPNYNAKNMKPLGDFIYKAARIWQQNTGLYTVYRGEAGYHYKQLYKSHLHSGQHAAAVKDWFYVNYGVRYNRIGSGAVQMSLDELWPIILDVLDLDDNHRSKFKTKNRGGEKGALQQIVNNHYACVIKEIRNPKLLQRETPTRQRTVSIPDTQIRYLTNARTRRRSV